jgi:hypothetical protein
VPPPPFLSLHLVLINLRRSNYGILFCIILIPIAIIDHFINHLR